MQTLLLGLSFFVFEMSNGAVSSMVFHEFVPGTEPYDSVISVPGAILLSGGHLSLSRFTQQ